MSNECHQKLQPYDVLTVEAETKDEQTDVTSISTMRKNEWYKTSNRVI